MEVIINGTSNIDFMMNCNDDCQDTCDCHALGCSSYGEPTCNCDALGCEKL